MPKDKPLKENRDKEAVRLDKTLLRQAEAREEARTLLMTGLAAALADDTMGQYPDAIRLAGFLLDYYGNRRYEKEMIPPEDAEILEEMASLGQKAGKTKKGN